MPKGVGFVVNYNDYARPFGGSVHTAELSVTETFSKILIYFVYINEGFNFIEQIICISISN